MDAFALTRCERCVAQGIAESQPVPLPKREEALKDLAQLGYEPAVYRLAELGIKR